MKDYRTRPTTNVQRGAQTAGDVGKGTLAHKVQRRQTQRKAEAEAAAAAPEAAAKAPEAAAPEAAAKAPEAAAAAPEAAAAAAPEAAAKAPEATAKAPEAAAAAVGEAALDAAAPAAEDAAAPAADAVAGAETEAPETVAEADTAAPAAAADGAAPVQMSVAAPEAAAAPAAAAPEAAAAPAAAGAAPEAAAAPAAAAPAAAGAAPEAAPAAPAAAAPEAAPAAADAAAAAPAAEEPEAAAPEAAAEEPAAAAAPEAAEAEPAAAEPAAAPVQAKAESSAEDPAQVQSAAAEGIAGAGGALPHGDAIQRSFGKHDVSGVKAHTDDKAAAAAGAMGAEAYATGDSVAFAGASPSLHLAAHEAAHTVQQKGGVQLAGGVGAVGDAYEQHADAVADAVVSGKSAEGLLDAGPGEGGGGGGGGVQRAPAKPPAAAAPPAPAAKPAAAAAKPAAPTAKPAAAAPGAAPAAPGAAPAPAAPAKPEKSKHGSGPAPGGWQGLVRGTTPSEAVTPDDPGHTYHILDDDRVVATTEPVLLAPGSSVSQRATATKPKSEQLIVAACQRFEITIGNAMAGIANGTVQTLMGRVRAYLDAKVAPFANNARQVETELLKLGGDLSQQWAGRLPKDLATIGTVLNGGGNIREAITMFNSFYDNILMRADLKEGLPDGAMTALLGEVKALPADAAARNAAAKELFLKRRAAAMTGVVAVQGWNPDTKAMEGVGTLNETRSKEIHEKVPSTDNPIEGAAVGGGATEGTPDMTGRYPAPAADKTRENDAWWLHQMTVAEFQALGGVLSEREKKLFNEGVYRQELAKRKDSIVDEATYLTAVAEAEAEAKKYVPWAAGFMGYNLLFEPAKSVNAAFEKLSVPVGAGVSGTTARTMAAMGSIGIDGTTGLKVCLGYLLPIMAHSFSEVRTAAVQMGVGGYAPARGSNNYNQAPLKGEIEGMAGWAEFDRLFSPAAIGDVAAKKS